MSHSDYPLIQIADEATGNILAVKAGCEALWFPFKWNPSLAFNWGCKAGLFDPEKSLGIIEQLTETSCRMACVLIKGGTNKFLEEYHLDAPRDFNFILINAFGFHTIFVQLLIY